MSDAVNVKIDAQKVDEVLATLSNHQTVNEILNEGLEATAKIYYNEILSSLRKEMGAAADTKGTRNRWNYFIYPLSSGIAIHPEPENTTYGVHALRDPRLLFFEGGTNGRYTKGNKITGYGVLNKQTGRVNYHRLKRTGKGGYRGMITANHFFQKGVQNAETIALSTLEETIIKAIRNKGIDIQ